MLGVAMHVTIKTLSDMGYSKKKIAEIVAVRGRQRAGLWLESMVQRF